MELISDTGFYKILKSTPPPKFRYIFKSNRRFLFKVVCCTKLRLIHALVY